MANSFARQQIGKYLGFLGHSMPGVELDCLPAPGDANPPFCYAHAQASVEMVYANMIISNFGYDIVIAEVLMETLLWRPQVEDPRDTTNSTLRIVGFPPVASAQV